MDKVKSAREWMPIETMPKTMEQVLIYNPHNALAYRIEMRPADGDFYRWLIKDGAKLFPTHWMYPPEPPLKAEEILKESK